MSNRFSVEAIFKAVDRITAPVSRMQNSVGRFTRSIEKGVSKATRVTEKIGSGIKRAAAVGAVASGLLGASMANVVNTGMEFEQQIINAAAHFDNVKKGSEAFNSISEAARNIGRTTEFSATQAGTALDDLAKAGFDVKSAIGSLPVVVDMATAAGIDLAEAGGVAVDALGAFAMRSTDAAIQVKNLNNIADVLAMTANKTTTDIVGLYEALKEGAPVATTAGASLYTFNALAGELANAGIKGSNAGTTLKNMFLNLTAATPQATKVLRRLGVSVKDSKGNFRDIIDILDDLNKALTGYGSVDKSALLESIFNRIPIAGVNVLLGVGADKLRAFRKELENSSGSSADMAALVRDSLNIQLRMFNNSMDSVKLSIFSIINGPLSELIKQFTAWTRANEKLISQRIGDFFNSLIKNFDKIVMWIKIIGASLVVFYTFITVLKTLALIMTVINLIMAANPITLIVLGVLAAIAVITVIIALIWKFHDAILGFVKANGRWIAAIGFCLGPIGMLIGAAALIIKYWDPIKTFFVDLWDGISKAFTSAFDKIKPIMDSFKGFGNIINSGFSWAGRVLGFQNGETEPQTSGGPVISSPQERTARMIEESRTISASEVTITDETGRAKVTKGQLGPGLRLVRSGAF